MISWKQRKDNKKPNYDYNIANNVASNQDLLIQPTVCCASSETPRQLRMETSHLHSSRTTSSYRIFSPPALCGLYLQSLLTFASTLSQHFLSQIFPQLIHPQEIVPEYILVADLALPSVSMKIRLCPGLLPAGAALLQMPRNGRDTNEGRHRRRRSQ